MTKTEIHLLQSLPVEEVARRLGIEVVRHSCRCFMHDDRHPSLSFSMGKNIWRCFVCDKGGGPIDLVMQRFGCGFREACSWLASSFGISLDGDSAATHDTHGAGLAPHLDPSLVDRSLSVASSFCSALCGCGILSSDQTTHAAMRYRLGATRRGGVIFWQIDERMRVRDGKVMFYDAECHRLHDTPPDWVSAMLRRQGLLPEGSRTAKCLFGLHLLSEPDGGDVAVVESEKTAVICSELFPGLLWMATGGLGNMNPSVLRPLRGRHVTLFPDTDPKGSAFRKWTEAARMAADDHGLDISVADILETHASAGQKQRGIDIADFITETDESLQIDN